MIEWLQTHFGELQIGLGLGFIVIAWLAFSPKKPHSSFRVREAQLREKKVKVHQPQKKAKSVDLDSPAHEILGIPEDAPTRKIKIAYRNRMKQFHPDRVAPPGTDKWKKAQKIASAITDARNSMMQTRASSKSNLKKRRQGSDK